MKNMDAPQRRIRSRTKLHLKLGSVFSFLKFSGILPFNKSGKYSRCLRWRYFIYLVCFTPTILVLPAVNFYFNALDGVLAEQDYAYLLTDYIRVLIRLAAIWSALFVSETRKEQFQTIWTSSDGMELSRVYRTQLIVLCLINAIQLIHWGIVDVIFFCDHKGDLYNTLMELLMLYTSWLLTLLTLFYCSLLKIFRCKCHSLRRYLKSFSDEECTSEFYSTMNLMTIVNRLSGYHVFFITTGCIIDLIQGGFSLVSYSYEPPFSLINWYKIVFRTVQLFNVLYNMCIQIVECTSALRKVDAFYRELFRLMRESQTLCSNKKLCLYVSMRKTVNFTACGFFSLGYPLITSIIAAATTYLVILVQFSIPKTS